MRFADDVNRATLSDENDPHFVRENKRALYEAATVLPFTKNPRDQWSPTEVIIRNHLTIANNERALGAEAVAKARQMLSQYRNCGWQIVDEHFAALEAR